MLNDIQNWFFTRKARAVTHGRYGDRWAAAIFRTTLEDKQRAIRETNKFIVIENGNDTFYFDRDPDVAKRKYGMRDTGTSTYSYHVTDWFNQTTASI